MSDLIDNKNTVCTYPWNSVYIDGSVKVCCNASGEMKNDDGNFTNLDDLKTQQNSKEWINLKQDLLDGVQHEHCNRCWRMEPNSFRAVHAKQFPETFDKIIEKNTTKSFELESLTLAIGNRCNLNCRMCSPDASSMIEKEWRREDEHPLNRKEHLRKDVIASDTGETTLFLSDARFLDFIKNNSSELKDIYMFGGEPFIIINEHLEFLQMLVNSGNAKNITLRYSTNGTNTTLRRFTELWSHFKQIDIQISCDGMEEVYDYIRWPSKWSKMKENLHYFADLKKNSNMHISVACTMQNLTIEQSVRFEAYIEDTYDLHVFYIPVDHPSEFSLNAVPLSVLKTSFEESANEQAKSIIKPYIDKYDENNSVSEFNNTLKVVKWQDQYRDQKLYDFFPVLKEWFKDNIKRNNYSD